MPVPVPSSSVSISISFVPADLLGHSWAVTDPAFNHTPALCVHPSGDTAHLAPLPVDFLCPSTGPLQKLQLVGNVTWNPWPCHHEASSNFLRVASPLVAIVCSRYPHATPCVWRSPGHYPWAFNSALSHGRVLWAGLPIAYSTLPPPCPPAALQWWGSPATLLWSQVCTELRFKISFLWTLITWPAFPILVQICIFVSFSKISLTLTLTSTL